MGGDTITACSLRRHPRRTARGTALSLLSSAEAVVLVLGFINLTKRIHPPTLPTESPEDRLRADALCCPPPVHLGRRCGGRGGASWPQRRPWPPPRRLTVGVVRVLHARHDAAPEDHPVLGEGAGLVGEDVLDLAQVLGDVERPALQLGARLGVMQLHVLVDEVHLAHLDDLDGHVQGDGDQNLEDTRAPRERRRARGLGAGPVGSRAKRHAAGGRGCTVPSGA